MFHTPYAGLSALADELVEVIDQRGRPFLLAPKQTALALNMPHRVALVGLRERGGRLWLTQGFRQKGDSRCWDFSAHGQILAGETRAGAAARLLEETLGLTDAQPVLRAVLPPLAFEGARQCVLFTAIQRGRHISFRGEGMFVDEDELSGLVEHFPDILSPCLLWCAQNGYL